MSPTIVGLLALAVVALVVIRAFALSQRRGSASVGPGTDHPTVWLKHAGDTAREGREIADDLEHQIQGLDSSASVNPESQQRLDALTHQLAELATRAPTSMDVRVCRSVAANSRALQMALRSDDDLGAAHRHVSVDRQELLDRHAQFSRRWATSNDTSISSDRSSSVTGRRRGDEHADGLVSDVDTSAVRVEAVCRRIGGETSGERTFG